MTPCLANSVPDVLGEALEPPVNPPPYIQTITGSCAPVVALAGRQTFKNRQSSDGTRAGGAPAAAAGGGPNRPCMQSAPNSAAWRTPVQRATGWGGRHRRSPTGGAAKGMPLKEATPSATTPRSSPPSTRTRGGACECATVPTPIAAASAASEQTRSLVTLEALLNPSPRSARIPHPFRPHCPTGSPPGQLPRLLCHLHDLQLLLVADEQLPVHERERRPVVGRLEQARHSPAA